MTCWWPQSNCRLPTCTSILPPTCARWSTASRGQLRAIARLQALGIESRQLGECLLGVLAQRPVRKVCRSSAQPTTLSDKLAALWPDLEGGLVVGAGCERCHGTGYSGRTEIYELFLVEPDVQDAIARGDAVTRYAARRDRPDSRPWSTTLAQAGGGVHHRRRSTPRDSLLAAARLISVLQSAHSAATGTSMSGNAVGNNMAPGRSVRRVWYSLPAGSV